MRSKQDSFCFSVGKSDICWKVEHLGLQVEWSLTLAPDDVVELWRLNIRNLSGRPRNISVYPYFPIGYMSWMNQSARYRPELGGVVASCVTPYQKVADHFKNKHFKDKTFLLHDREPVSFETNREVFEGEGGLHYPSGVQAETLSNGDAIYETPVAALHYRLALAAEQSETYRFLLGPAFDDAEVADKRSYFDDADFAQARAEYSAYVAKGKGVIEINTPDPHFDQFVNHWLPRQVYYHGDVNRLTTDPQTRNLLQDQMGMAYLRPAVARKLIDRIRARAPPVPGPPSRRRSPGAPRRRTRAARRPLAHGSPMTAAYRSAIAAFGWTSTTVRAPRWSRSALTVVAGWRGSAATAPGSAPWRSTASDPSNEPVSGCATASFRDICAASPK